MRHAVEADDCGCSVCKFVSSLHGLVRNITSHAIRNQSEEVESLMKLLMTLENDEGTIGRRIIDEKTRIL